MATKVVTSDEAIVVTFLATDTDNDHVIMGPTQGGKAAAQIEVIGENLEGSNDGVNFQPIHLTTTAANEVVEIPAVPLFMRNPTTNTGGIIVVGWQA